MKKVFAKDELPKIAQEILQSLNLNTEATVVALSGDLGVGKTTLVQEIAKQLGVKEMIISPTFVIMKKYPLRDLVYENFIHIDAYRLKNGDELLKLGWKELIADSKNIIFIEWPERVAEVIPSEALRVALEHESEEERKINLM